MLTPQGGLADPAFLVEKPNDHELCIPYYRKCYFTEICGLMG